MKENIENVLTVLVVSALLAIIAVIVYSPVIAICGTIILLMRGCQ